VNGPDPHDTSQLSLLDLFRAEVENHSAVLSSGLLELERSADPAQALQDLMRAAHSLKGASRIINLPAAVQVAHAMEDCFVAAQQGRLQLRQAQIDVLLQATDLFAQLARRTNEQLSDWEQQMAVEIAACLRALNELARAQDRTPEPGGAPPGALTAAPPQPAVRPPPPAAPPEPAAATPTPAPFLNTKPEAADRVVRLTAESLNRLLGLAGESLVESRWLRPFTDSLQKLKRHNTDLAERLEALRQCLQEYALPERAKTHFSELFQQLAESRQFLAERVQELDLFDRRAAHLSHRLYLEVLRTRMRPFGDGVRRFPRMVRDLARSLGKEVRLEISGESTQVDRDILERLETPLAHLLRNAVDHGCQTRAERLQAGKPPENTIRLEARHSAGMLLVSVSDDGAGVELEQVRQALLKHNLVEPALASRLGESQLLEFLFRPGFTLRDQVTELSGRGVGLDVVQNMVRSVRGAIRVNNQPGRGFRVQLQLPLTLSVLRALLVEVDAEPYAIPLNQIQQALKLPRHRLMLLEGRPHFEFHNQPVGLVPAHHLLDLGAREFSEADLPVVVIGDRHNQCGLVVDRFLGERELVVQPLDGRLGKIQDISAAALMEDGNPVLILDVDDLLRSGGRLEAASLLGAAWRPKLLARPQPAKRVLVIDDSLAVRELERKVLTQRGYLADAVGDAKEALRALQTGQYDLVITDADMPGTDGVELTREIKRNPHWQSLPVMMLSYKDREEDRIRGLEAGADFYLTKEYFDDQTLLQVVNDLIGPPER